MRRAPRVTLLCLLLCAKAFSAEHIDFWDTPQHGANSFNEAPPDAEYFRALRAYGATLGAARVQQVEIQRAGLSVRQRWTNIEAWCRMISRRSGASSIDAHAAGLKVVLTPLSLPGARWSQQNDNKFDDRLWSDATLLATVGRILARPVGAR